MCLNESVPTFFVPIWAFSADLSMFSLVFWTRKDVKTPKSLEKEHQEYDSYGL